MPFFTSGKVRGVSDFFMSFHQNYVTSLRATTVVKYKFHLFTRARAISTNTKQHSHVYDKGTGGFKISNQQCMMGVQYGRLSKKKSFRYI